MIHTLEVVLRQHPFFQGMEDKHVELIAGCARNVRFDEGHVIFREGDPADHFYLIREGLASVQLSIPNRGLTTVHTVGEGDVLGWSWLFPPHRWHFDAHALTAVRATSFDGICLRGKCDADPALGYELVSRFAQTLIERLQWTRLRLLDVYGHAGQR